MLLTGNDDVGIDIGNDDGRNDDIGNDDVGNKDECCLQEMMITVVIDH